MIPDSQDKIEIQNLDRLIYTLILIVYFVGSNICLDGVSTDLLHDLYDI